MSDTSPAAGPPEQALQELMNLVIDKLEACTPGKFWQHTQFESTKSAVTLNAPLLVAALKDSPTFANLLKSMSAAIGDR